MANPSLALEAVKIIAGVATPILVALIGFRLNKIMQSFSAAQWGNQKLIEKRLDIFDKVAPEINALYCYIRFIGAWKELTPEDILKIKRDLDKTFHVYSAIFSPRLMETYLIFIKTCFRMFVGPSKDALIRSVVVDSFGNDRRICNVDWRDEWTGMFTEESESYEVIKDSYNSLMHTFSVELGLGLESRFREQPNKPLQWTGRQRSITRNNHSARH